MKSRFGFLAVALLTNAARASGQTRSKLLGVNVDLMDPLPAAGHVHPYVLSGLGTYHATISMTEDTPSQLSSADTSESTVAWNLGAGITIGGSVTTPFIETRRHLSRSRPAFGSWLMLRSAAG